MASAWEIGCSDAETACSHARTRQNPSCHLVCTVPAGAANLLMIVVTPHDGLSGPTLLIQPPIPRLRAMGW
jgi:hypothetical protein